MKPSIIIGIDPGDRWTGVAQLLIEEESIVVGTFVIDGAARTINEIVNVALLDRKAFVIAEEYRARPIGHQRFGASLTPRILGALEYRVNQLRGAWMTVAAGSPQGVWGYPVGKILRHWKRSWPLETDSRWEHALSAWRVMCTALMRKYPNVYQTIDRVKVHQQQLDESTVLSNVDLIAPYASYPLL